MKKNNLIKGLMLMGLIGLGNLESQLALAEKQNDSGISAESSEINIVNKTTEPIVQTTIEISSEKTTLEVTETLTLTSKITPEDSNNKLVTWTTSDETIATVSDSGIVTGKKAGSVSITASTLNGKTALLGLTFTEKKEAVTGTYGTVPWEWDAETQTLTFGEGNFPTSDWLSGIQPKIEKSARLEGKKIKKIIFTKPVVANQSSDYLFFELGGLEAIEGLELLNTSLVSGMAYMFGASFGPGNKLSKINVSNWDTRNVRNMSYMFASASSLKTLDVSNWDTANVTNMFAMFRDASNLTTLDVSKWDTRNVSSMADMFRDANNLIALETGNWNTSNVTDMSYMFNYAKSLTTLDVSNWDTSKVTNMFNMFNNVSSLTILDVSKWNTSKVTNMRNMFYCAKSLAALDVRSWSTGNVTDMAYTFGWMNNLKSLDVSLWDTSNVTNMQAMFLHTEGLATLDVSKWTTSKVSDMAYMFRGANSLTTLDVSNWDTSKVVSMEFMFYNIKNLKALDVSNWDTSNVAYMQNMFNFAASLTTINVSMWNTSKVNDMSHMFASTSNLEVLDVSKWNTSNVKNMNNMFYNAKKLKVLDVSIWDTSNVKNMNNMFNFTTTLTTIDVSKWNTSNVTDMSNMFRNASNLEVLDVRKWNTSCVKNMAYMFYNAKNLKALDVSIWDTSSVKDMNNMFNRAASLKTLNLGKWSTNMVTDMSYMFELARNLTTAEVSGWDTSNVTNMACMFYDARNLTEIDISKWDTSKVTKIEQLFAYTNNLSILILGKNSSNLLKEAGIPEKKDHIYTGQWTLSTPDIHNSYSSSQDLMANYDGTKPGKYVREKVGDSTKVSGIELAPPTIQLAVSEEVTLQAKITPATASNKKVTYTTSDNSVVTVSADGIVKGLKKGTTVITATTEDGNFQAISTVTVVETSTFLLDTFYLGIDKYITGSIDASSSAKKVQLVINDEVITTSTLFRDGSFELNTEGMITKVTDKVEVIALDRKNKEIDRTIVLIEEKSYALTVNPYTLFEDSIVTGKTDYFHTHVALVINGEEIERKLLSSTRKFSFDVEGLIDYADDEVEIVGYRYEEEITRKEITIQEPVIEMALAPYKVDEPYVTGKVTGKSAKNVRLYVNGRRQQTIKVAEDGRFSLLGVAILSPKDKVQLAVLNDDGIEIQRFSVKVTN